MPKPTKLHKFRACEGTLYRSGGSILLLVRARSRWGWRLEGTADGRTLVYYKVTLRGFSSVVESLEDDQQTMTVGVNVGTVVAATKAIKRESERQAKNVAP